MKCSAVSLFLFFSSLSLLSFINCASLTVNTATSLQQALNQAVAGDTITLADNTVFQGKFTINKNGTENAPIVITGSPSSIMQCGSISSNYGLYLIYTSYVTVTNITVRNCKKGIMIDGGHHTLFDGITVYNIGEEGVHFRDGNSYSTITNSHIYQVGVLEPKYGEGVYVGSDYLKWDEYEKACDYIKIINNLFGPDVAAEPIDIKEGSSYTWVEGNIFNSSGIQGQNGGDSWMDVKGNNCTITKNIGYQWGVTDPALFADGYQTNNKSPGWGYGNIFTENIAHFETTFAGNLVKVNNPNVDLPNIVCTDNVINGGGRLSNRATTNCKNTSESTTTTVTGQTTTTDSGNSESTTTTGTIETTTTDSGNGESTTGSSTTSSLSSTTSPLSPSTTTSSSSSPDDVDSSGSSLSSLFFSAAVFVFVSAVIVF